MIESLTKNELFMTQILVQAETSQDLKLTNKMYNNTVFTRYGLKKYYL